ncbi:hypothetical protein STEG23_016362 [Scotinomys teguina]
MEHRNRFFSNERQKECISGWEEKWRGTWRSRERGTVIRIHGFSRNPDFLKYFGTFHVRKRINPHHSSGKLLFTMGQYHYRKPQQIKMQISESSPNRYIYMNFVFQH